MPGAGTSCSFPRSYGWARSSNCTTSSKDLVAYRGESGQVAILDAHCPHLGANLGSGEGRVRGDNIACPFHGWTFNPQGQCVDIPYAKAIPEKAVNALKGWPVLEKNGFIALWYEREGEAPENYLPDIPSGDRKAGATGFSTARASAPSPATSSKISSISHTFPTSTAALYSPGKIASGSAVSPSYRP